MSQKEIDHLKSRIGVLEAKLRNAKEELYQAQCQHTRLRPGVVVFTNNGKEYQITRVEFWGNYMSTATISLYGNARKKGGDWSLAEHYIHDWTLVPPAINPGGS